MKIENKETGIIAMNKLVWFITHYEWENVSYEIPWSGETKTEWLPKFIGKVEWGCNTEHIVGKWKDVQEKYGYELGVIYLYFGLDNENAKKLFEYVIDNYDNERNILR